MIPFSLFPREKTRSSLFPMARSIWQSLAALLVCSALLLSACGGQSSSGPTVTLKLLMHNNPATVAVIKKISQQFEQKYPNIHINITAISPDQWYTVQQTRLTAKDVDIFETFAFTGAPTSWAPTVDKPSWEQWIESGLLTDLTNQPFVKNYYPSALANASTFKDKIYTITTGSYIETGVFYNKTLFNQYHVKVPTTWSEMTQAMHTFKANGVAPFTMGGKDGWPANVAMVGLFNSMFPDPAAAFQQLWQGSLKFSDPRFAQILERGQNIFQNTEQGFLGIDTNTAVTRFAAGKAAMLPAGSWDGANIEKANPDLQFGMFPMPASDTAANNANFAGKYDIAWSVPSASQHRNEDLEWLSFFSQPDIYAEYVNATGIIPSQPNVKISDRFLGSIAPKAANLKLDWSQVQLYPKGSGQYAGCGPTSLVPVGTINTPAELLPKCQADWDAGQR